MIDADHRVRESGGKVEEIVEILDARVDARDKIMSLQMLEAGAPGAVDEVTAIRRNP